MTARFMRVWVLVIPPVPRLSPGQILLMFHREESKPVSSLSPLDSGFCRNDRNDRRPRRNGRRATRE